jgi:hypothetical protein
MTAQQPRGPSRHDRAQDALALDQRLVTQVASVDPQAIKA